MMSSVSVVVLKTAPLLVSCCRSSAEFTRLPLVGKGDLPKSAVHSQGAVRFPEGLCRLCCSGHWSMAACPLKPPVFPSEKNLRHQIRAFVQPQLGAV